MKEINTEHKKRILDIFTFPGLLILLFFVNACTTDFPIQPFYEGEDESISDYINEKQDTFSFFNDALINTNLLNTLSARNPNGNQYTLFLPTNEAFERFIASQNDYNSIEELMNDQAYLMSLVKYHVVNSAYQTSDFPFGALPDTTISGEILNVGFSGSWDSTVFRINNQASVIQPNIQMVNGYIHVIDEVLTPVVLNSYEWLKQHQKFSIFTQALEKTGLKDTFAMDNDAVLNTLLVEPDDVYNKKGIYTLDDLIREISPDNDNYTSSDNELYQFLAYHIVEGDHFLNDFEEVRTNFNTYAIYPLFVNGEGLDIHINTGAEVFDSVFTEQDTTIINSIGIDYEQSNNLTKNGAVHQIDQVMKLYRPRPNTRSFKFYEESIINEASRITRVYEFNPEDRSKFEFLHWEGVEDLVYVKTSGIDAYNDDYIYVDGDFEITYEIPKILPGEYQLQIRAQTVNSSNATIQVFLDDKRVGGNIDLTIGPDKWGNEFLWLDVGTINLENYQTHTIKIKSLISGTFYWDEIRFQY